MLLVIVLLPSGCERTKPLPPGQAPTVVSLVPSATELIFAMGCGDHLVGVSNFENSGQAASLPRVGDYQSVDWEKIAQLRPSAIVTNYGPGRTPPGFLERCRQLNIRQVNVKLNRLDDIYTATSALGEACQHEKRADAEARQMRADLAKVHAAVAGLPRVRAVIALGASSFDLAGRDTYLDDLLQAAGGQNAVTASGYVTLDREAAASLDPQIVLLLLPDGDQKAISTAQALWAGIAAVSADKDHRLWIFRDSYIMHPGPRVADVARKFAAALHPNAQTQPATSTSGPS